MAFATISLSTSVQSSQALHQRGQRLTVSLLFGSSSECRQYFWQGLLAAYVDLCKSFDSVNRDALWGILGLYGVTPKLINVMSELHSGTESAVRCGDTISDLFPVVNEVRQGCVLVMAVHTLIMLMTNEQTSKQTDRITDNKGHLFWRPNNKGHLFRRPNNKGHLFRRPNNKGRLFRRPNILKNILPTWRSNKIENLTNRKLTVFNDVIKDTNKRNEELM